MHDVLPLFGLSKHTHAQEPGELGEVGVPVHSTKVIGAEFRRLFGFRVPVG